MNNNISGYGSHLSANQIITFIDHVFSLDDSNLELVKPICIWGKAGIGKTQLIKDFAIQRGYEFAYCAPAQFEEMGDFHGIPYVLDGKTVYNQPEWVPTKTEKPGILLIDDFNRADDRILRGLMQLFQYHGMMSWNLPSNWRIICTANPEGEDYSITTLDDAMLSRMMHVTLKFEPNEWAQWALLNNVDERGIDFVLTYPEIVEGKFTNPRTLTSFFYHTKSIIDLKKSIEFLYPLASAFLDKETASSFIVFVNDELENIIPPEEILKTAQFEFVMNKIKETCVFEDNIRLDILSTITTRLVIYLKYNINSIESFENLSKFLLMDFLPKDLRATFHLDLLSLKNLRLTQAINTQKLAKLLVGDNS
jgi:hypothetical protein